MGFSVSAVFMVLAVAVVLAFNIFAGALMPTLSHFNVSIHETKERGLQNVQSRLNITNVTDGETGFWWDTSFGFRKKIDITGSKAAGTKYPIKLIIASSPRITDSYDFTLEGLAYDFPNDIRFYDQDNNNELDYWIENTSADPISVWVEVGADLETDQSVYVYYGSPDASSSSNGEDTFNIFFDDFETDLSKWETNEQCSSAHVELNDTRSTEGNSSVYIYTDSAGCRAQLNLTVDITIDVAIEFDWAPKASFVDYQTFWTLTAEGGFSIGNLYAAEDVTPFNFCYYNGAALVPLTATYTVDMEWHHIQEFYDLFNDVYDIYIDDILQKTDANFVNPVANIGFITFQSGAGGDEGHQFLDTFRIRKWVDPEPAFASADPQETILLTVEIENTGSISLSTSDFFILVNGTKYNARANISSIYPLNEEKVYTTTQTPYGMKRVKIIAATNVEDYYQQTE
ncbi:MAG: DUF2341 domain-containing protein [Methanobacteriota archaeon]